MAQKHLEAYLLVADKEQEELLIEWALPNLMEKTTKPILIGDIGLSEKAKKYITHQRIEVDSRDTLTKGGWFYKPMMISKAWKLSEKTLYIDNDIEIKESLDPVFDMIEDGKILIAEDWARKPMLNSGIVGVSRCELLNKWEEMIAQDTVLAHGDQEVLDALLRRFPKYRDQIKMLPQEWHWQRLMIEGGVRGIKKARAIHWTGALGKAHIRKALWRE